MARALLVRRARGRAPARPPARWHADPPTRPRARQYCSSRRFRSGCTACARSALCRSSCGPGRGRSRAPGSPRRPPTAESLPEPAVSRRVLPVRRPTRHRLLPSGTAGQHRRERVFPGHVTAPSHERRRPLCEVLGRADRRHRRGPAFDLGMHAHVHIVRQAASARICRTCVGPAWPTQCPGTRMNGTQAVGAVADGLRAYGRETLRPRGVLHGTAVSVAWVWRSWWGCISSDSPRSGICLYRPEIRSWVLTCEFVAGRSTSRA
jgi:hypothetical protein